MRYEEIGRGGQQADSSVRVPHNKNRYPSRTDQFGIEPLYELKQNNTANMLRPSGLQSLLARIRNIPGGQYCSAGFWLVALAGILCAKYIPTIDSTPQAALPVSWMSQVAAMSGESLAAG